MEEVNSVDDLIKFVERNINMKLKWYYKLWIRLSSWADYKLERAFKMR